MALTITQRKYLRGLAHPKKPVIMVGSSGLTDGVMNEFIQTLAHHELIKMKVAVGDREQRDEIVKGMCEQSGAELVQRIGNIATVYKAREKDARIQLPRD